MIWNILNRVRDLHNLLLAIGVYQLLEKYTHASLQSQHSQWFPTQAWKVVSQIREEVTALEEKWSWGKEELKYAGIEAPEKVKDRLLLEGIYKPAVSLAMAQGSTIRKDTKLLENDDNLNKKSIKDLFHDDGQSVRPLAGEYQMEVPAKWKPAPRRMQTQSQSQSQGLFHVDDEEEDANVGDGRMIDEEDIAAIEKELKLLAKSIVKSSTERQQQTDLEKYVYAALSKDFEWRIRE